METGPTAVEDLEFWSCRVEAGFRALDLYFHEEGCNFPFDLQESVGQSVLLLVSSSIQRLSLALAVPFRLPPPTQEKFYQAHAENSGPVIKAQMQKVVSKGQLMINNLGADLLGKAVYTFFVISQVSVRED